MTIKTLLGVFTLGSSIIRRVLLASTILAGVVSVGASAHAQTKSSTPGGVAAADKSPEASEVVVTGSILRRSLSSTDAPLTVTTADDLGARGITTMTDAIQQLSANGAGSLPNAFTGNGAFAAGAAAVSLRGLTSNSTLTVIDGLRTAYYPLADDGVRNFVDLNSIPNVIVDRIETLKDGASSTYGADAIAGVINVITKRNYEGVTVKAEGGTTQHGGGDTKNLSVLAGRGDLSSDGYNVYIGAEYQHDSIIFNRQRGFPFNTADPSSICGVSLVDGTKTCATNAIRNGLQFDGSFQGVSGNGVIVPIVRPFTPNADGTFTPAGDFRLLNPSAGCGPLKSVTVTPAQAAAGGATGITAPVTLCQQDFVHDYGIITPDDERFSVSARATKRFNNGAEAYVTATYYQNDVFSPQAPSRIRDVSTPGAQGLVFSTAGTPGIILPVFVCAAGVNCNASNGSLNPNNPFAALGQVASIRYSFGDITASSEQISKTYRFAAGVNGEFDLLGKWTYAANITGAETDLKNITKGTLFIDGLLKAVNTGAYNFVNPSANTDAVRQLISPDNIQNSRSKLGMVEAHASRELFTLPGGPVQLGVGVSALYESVFNPSANPDDKGPTARYFTINPFGTIGSRSAEGAFFEVDAPVTKQLDVKLSGRYDDYSTGQSNFSPKIGAILRPFADWAPTFDVLTLRSSYSQGFRIPSFAEANSLPTTGFVTANAPKSFQAAHGNDGYGVGYALGETTQGTAGLRPEKSDNFTVGFVVEPNSHLSASLDFYRIEKKSFITRNTSNLAAAIAAYYAGTPIPTGYSVIAGPPDPNHPDLQPLLGFIKFGFTNLGTETASGYDIAATARFDLPYDIHFTSNFDGNYVLRLNLNPGDGSPVQHYAGTIGPYNDVAAGGTPKFRANWTNTLAWKDFTVSATAYYTAGYDLQAEDFGDTTGVCVAGGASASSINATFLDGVTPIRCSVKAYWYMDLHGTYQVRDNLQFYATIGNVFDYKATYDPTTYGGQNYNSTFDTAGIFGRSFKVGVKATF